MNKPILEILKEERIFEIEKKSTNSFLAVEMCDEWFAVELSKEQLLQLAEEIKALANE